MSNIRYRFGRLAAAVFAVAVVFTSVAAFGDSFVSQKPDDPSAGVSKTELIGQAPKTAVLPEADPMPTESQRFVAEGVTALLTGDRGKPDPDGVPISFSSGVIGAYGTPTEGYSIVFGEGSDPDGIVHTLTALLSQSEASQLVTVVRSEVSTADLAVLWREILSNSWLGDGDSFPAYALDVDAAKQKLVINIGGDVTDEQIAALKSMGRTVLEVNVVGAEGAVFRASSTNTLAPR